ncbi:MAG: alkaline shock response membrane anchor protein AmaP [Opitutaceae bacterium]
MKPPEIIETLQNIISEPVYLYIGGAVLLLCFLFILYLRRQPSKVLAYATENGRVMVSRSAIVELVQTSCEQLNVVTKPRVRIKVKGQFTHLEVTIKLLSGGYLRAVEDTLQTHLRAALSQNLGIEELGQINIVADGFKSGKIEKAGTVGQLPDANLDVYEEDNFDALDDTEENKPV